MRSEEFNINCIALTEARETLDQNLQAAMTKLAGGNPEATVTLKIKIETEVSPDGKGLIPTLTHTVSTNIPHKYSYTGVSKPDLIAYRNGEWIVQDLQVSLFDEEEQE